MTELLHVSTGSYQAILWVGMPRQRTPPLSPRIPLPRAPPSSPEASEPSYVSTGDHIIHDLALIDALLAELAADTALLLNMTPQAFTQHGDPFSFREFDLDL